MIQRSLQLLKASSVILQREGVPALFERLQRWLKGERRYFTRYYAHPMDADSASSSPLAVSLNAAGLIPPIIWIREIGSTSVDNFLSVGQGVCQDLSDLAGLTPESHVLDIGCGIGRAAIPLTQMLSDKGSYAGFDIVKPMIDWCQQHLTPRYPNFQFDWINLYNKLYNPNGKGKATEFRFPYEDQRFDVILLTSVFTHLPPKEVDHYLAEMRRVLKPGGRCLASFFLLNEESISLINQPDVKSIFDFPVRYVDQHYAIQDAASPMNAVAYEEAYLRQMVAATQLRIVDIAYGSWAGRQQTRSGQDYVILTTA